MCVHVHRMLEWHSPMQNQFEGKEWMPFFKSPCKYSRILMLQHKLIQIFHIRFYGWGGHKVPGKHISVQLIIASFPGCPGLISAGTEGTAWAPLYAHVRDIPENGTVFLRKLVYRVSVISCIIVRRRLSQTVVDFSAKFAWRGRTPSTCLSCFHRRAYSRTGQHALVSRFP